jgi:excinuclease UvrABC nuclease subunit
MNKTTIYGLYSTRDNTIRYIGKANDPKNRLRSHVWSSQARVDDSYSKS